MENIEVFYERLNNFDKRLERIEDAIISISENLNKLSAFDIRIKKIEQDLEEAFVLIRDVKKNGTDNCKFHLANDSWTKERLQDIDNKIKSTNHYLIWLVIVVIGSILSLIILKS